VREGIPIDLVVGCSGGSVVASAIALGFDAETCMRMAAQLWTRDATSQPDRLAMLRSVFPRLLGFRAERFGLRQDGPLRRALEGAFGGRSFAETRIPLHITATDFHTGEQVVLSSGSIVEAIRASIAIPFAFAPHPHEGRLLIDGFMSDPLPVNVAMREGGDVIVAMGFDSPYQTHVRSAGRFAFQLSSIMTNNLLKASFAFHGLAHHGEVLLVMPQFEQRVRLFDTAKIPYIADVGERAIEAQLPYLRRLLAAPVSAPVGAPDGLAPPSVAARP
jgi:NTE family protein